jgi:hypothetical protein
MSLHKIQNALFCFTLAAAAPIASRAGGVTCHYVYGGEEHVLAVAPTAAPYTVPAITVGSYFQFRVVLEEGPRAAVHVYTYAAHGESRALVHEAAYRYPPGTDAGADYGFTGYQRVYEPALGSELEYWCEAAQAVAAQP